MSKASRHTHESPAGGTGFRSAAGPRQGACEAPRGGSECQLSGLRAGCRSLSLRDWIRHGVLRLLSALDRRIVRIYQSISASPARSSGGGCIGSSGKATDQLFSQAHVAEDLRPGDVVEVLTREEILSTLDANRRCDGLEFMEAMAEFCGQRLVVRKKVRLLFDEGNKRFLKVKRPRYILEGAICEGVSAYDKEGCDRSCFFFWSPRWLRRAPSTDGADAGSREQTSERFGTDFPKPCP